MHKLKSVTRSFVLAALLLFPAMVFGASIADFEGTFKGDAEFNDNGEMKKRDMSTTIKPTEDGFELSWTSVSYKDDGRVKAKTYNIGFIPSDRDNIYKSAMKTSVFGKPIPLDPMKGEPFVWARLEGETLSVFSLFINDVGEYEMQEFHRTLVPAGLDLKFRRLHNGQIEKEIRALLVRVE